MPVTVCGPRPSPDLLLRAKEGLLMSEVARVLARGLLGLSTDRATSDIQECFGQGNVRGQESERVWGGTGVGSRLHLT